MEKEIAAELTWAEAGEDVLGRQMQQAQRLMDKRVAEDPGALLGEGAPAGDIEFLRRPDVVVAFRRIIAEQARGGVGGCVDDTLAFVRDWGFDPADIMLPVLLTYGDADTSCPVAHGRFLAAVIPTATVVETAGGGHLPGDPRDEILATHRWLRTGSL
jgi:pimeloyl-ACP methyl ester carboxylesterase